MMRLIIFFAVFLAVSRAQEIEKTKTENKEVEIDDSEAIASAASLEILRAGQESIETAASTNSVQARQQRPPWSNYIPNQGQFPSGQFPSGQFPSGQFPQIPSQGQWGQNIPGSNYFPINNYFPGQGQKPQNDYVPPQSNPVPPQNNYVPPQNNYVPPQNNYVPPENNYIPPQATPSPPQNDYYRPPQNNHPNPPQNNYNPPPKPIPTTTTEAVTVIKNEQILGENGNYKFEYQISDGTWVGEEGFIKNPNTEHAIVVKKGWYSYYGADGKQYTVTWWADDTGYHAFGDHLPVSPPIPPEIQAALDQAAKEEAAKAEAEKNKPQQPPPQHPHYDTPQQYPQQQYPPQQNPQPQYPQQQYPQQQYPQQQNPQQQYPPQQNPQQQYPSQQYPPQQYPQQQNPPPYRPPNYAKRGSRRFRRKQIKEE